MGGLRLSGDTELQIKSEQPLMYKCDCRGAFWHQITRTAKVAVQSRQGGCWKREPTVRTRPPTRRMTVITDNNLPLSETHGCQERSDFQNLERRRRPSGHVHQICISSAFSCPRHMVSLDLVPSQLTAIINYTTGSVWMYSKLKSGLPAEQIQLADMIPGMFLEACANDSEHIAARC